MAELEEYAVFNWAWSDKLVTAMMSNDETLPKVQARRLFPNFQARISGLQAHPCL